MGMIFVQRPQTHEIHWVFEMNFRVPHQAKYMVSWIVPIFQSHSDAVGTAHRITLGSNNRSGKPMLVDTKVLSYGLFHSRLTMIDLVWSLLVGSVA